MMKKGSLYIASCDIVSGLRQRKAFIAPDKEVVRSYLKKGRVKGRIVVKEYSSSKFYEMMYEHNIPLKILNPKRKRKKW